MNPRQVLALYLALSLVQIGLPLRQIWRHEDVLKTGHVYKFRTAPVDPYDAFRGKYVALSYADTAATIRAGDAVRPGNTAYVRLGQGPDGFVVFGEMSVDPPASGDYLRVKCQYPAMGDRANFRLPFDRFYMEESQAPRAEAAYRRFGNRRDRQTSPAYALVRVKEGRGIIQDLYVNDQPIREFIKNEPAR